MIAAGRVGRGVSGVIAEIRTLSAHAPGHGLLLFPPSMMNLPEGKDHGGGFYLWAECGGAPILKIRSGTCFLPSFVV